MALRLHRLLLPLLLLLFCVPYAQARQFHLYDGPPLPDFTLKDLDGASHTLSDYRGRVVVVNFWATWCPSCIKELPSLERLSKKFHGKPFSILAVDMGEKPGAVQAFLKRFGNKPPFPILLDSNGKTAGAAKVIGLPSSFVLDKKGKVRFSLRGSAEWDDPVLMAPLRLLMDER